MNKLKALQVVNRAFRHMLLQQVLVLENMLAHSCVKDLSNTKITTFTTSSSFSQVELNTMMNNYKKVKLNEK